MLSGHHHPVNGGVCSHLAGAIALKVRLELALFSLAVCFSFSSHQVLCSKGGDWWSKWDSCAYWGPMLCLFRHLWLCSDTAHSGFFPGCARPHPNLELHCCIEWAGLQCLLSWGWGTQYEGHRNCSCCQKSGLLLGCHLSKHNGCHHPTWAILWGPR